MHILAGFLAGIGMSLVAGAFTKEWWGFLLIWLALTVITRKEADA